MSILLSTGEVAALISVELGETWTEKKIQGVLRSTPEISPGMVSNRRAWSETDVDCLKAEIRARTKAAAVRKERPQEKPKRRQQGKGSYKSTFSKSEHYYQLLSVVAEGNELVGSLLKAVEGEGLVESLHLDSDQIDALRELGDHLSAAHAEGNRP